MWTDTHDDVKHRDAGLSSCRHQTNLDVQLEIQFIWRIQLGSGRESEISDREGGWRDTVWVIGGEGGNYCASKYNSAVEGRVSWVTGREVEGIQSGLLEGKGRGTTAQVNTTWQWKGEWAEWQGERLKGYSLGYCRGRGGELLRK